MASPAARLTSSFSARARAGYGLYLSRSGLQRLFGDPIMTQRVLADKR